MGLQADQVPADMRKQLYQKLGLTLPEDSQPKTENSGKKRKEAA